MKPVSLNNIDENTEVIKLLVYLEASTVVGPIPIPVIYYEIQLQWNIHIKLFMGYVGKGLPL